ncbi:MAG: hypothetical protein FJ118_14920 [Deltaproteobacteria bacterium]|nr:hypothetical protein [Deltaproteobacteria bacterium]
MTVGINVLMEVHFCKGSILKPDGRRLECEWAVTRFGILALSDRGAHELEILPAASVVSSEIIASVDLEGLDEGALRFVVRSILKRKHLSKPGVKGKGDAVLFVLVNEALHDLAKANEEEMV